MNEKSRLESRSVPVTTPRCEEVKRELYAKHRPVDNMGDGEALLYYMEAAESFGQLARMLEMDLLAARSENLPQEPTHEMRMAGAKAFDRTKNPYVAVLPIWRAMVEAARMAEISSKIAPDDERLSG